MDAPPPPATAHRATSTSRNATAHAAVVATADELRRLPLTHPPCEPRARSDWINKAFARPRRGCAWAAGS